ncbi:hypothetical protein GQ42DRAFT_152954 [Ramicandelaber brevisporus]|nr:hypothetical protein GQ42DRAFT_152954 [Ramicandelaber brevisporus]
MTGSTAVSVEEVEVPLLPAYNKEFYRDLDVPQHASQDEVLEAATHAFYQLCGYYPSPTTAEPVYKVVKKDVLTKSTTILTAFSTLYDAKSRAAYDKFGDRMFKLLNIDSHVAIGHPSAFNKWGWELDVRLVLVAFLFMIGLDELLIYYDIPGRATLVNLTPVFILLGTPTIITIRNIVRYLYLSSTSEIKQANPHLTSAIDPSREHLVRLYGSHLVFSESAQAILFLFCGLAHLILFVVFPTGVDYISLLYIYVILSAIVSPIVGFGTSFSTFAHNGGYSVPHLGIFFHTVASRVSVDLPNLNAESREKLFELIDSVVFTARRKALVLNAPYIATVASVTLMPFTWNLFFWLLVVSWVAYFGTYYGFVAIVNIVMYLSKRHWSYTGYAQHSAA